MNFALATFFQFALSGMTTGCVYALVALGFVLCANVSGIVNFAQGEYVMLGGLIVTSLLAMRLPLPPALLLTAVAGGILGALQQVLTIMPIRTAPHFVHATITLAVAAVLRGLALIVWGPDPYSLAGFSGNGVFEMLGALLPRQTFWIWGATALLMLVLFCLLKFTQFGRAIRACANNQVAARLMGIDTGRTTVAVFALAGMAGAVGGAVIAPIALSNWSAGLDYGLKGFIGAILGGFSSVTLAVIGGIGIGIVESLAAGYISSEVKDIATYSLLLVYLLIRGGVFARGRMLPTFSGSQ
jgi:branched-subunit amino acid ABC-type transport system permease component